MAPELFKENEIKEPEENDPKKDEYDKSCDIFSLSIILWQMLNGYKSKPFNTCKKSDIVYKLMYQKDYNSFWKSSYHKHVQFLGKNSNPFDNTNDIKNLFEEMFTFDPIKRIKAQEIEHHAWFIDMDCNAKMPSQISHQSELRNFYHEINHKKIAEKSKDLESIGTLYSTQNTNKNKSSSSKRVIVGYSDTQPENESSLEISVTK